MGHKPPPPGSLRLRLCHWRWVTIVAKFQSAAAPVLLVRKPGGPRFRIGYCALNASSVKNRYPIPLIGETLAKLFGAVRFTKLDVIHAPGMANLNILSCHLDSAAHRGRFRAAPTNPCMNISTFLYRIPR